MKITVSHRYTLVAIAVHLVRISAAAKNTSRSAYDFVFGFSTGHVGTTTLSEGRYYGMPEHVAFLHELHYGAHKIANEDIMTTRKWKKEDFEGEYDYVKDVYVPFLLLSKRNKDTLMDLGHNNLYFVSALVKYLIEKSYRFIFVRIRRNRMETAISLAYKHPDEKYEDLCDYDEGLVTRFCPYDREDEVILHPPSREVWASFSVFQQALWISDETEARWQQLLRQYPSIERLEIYWGKQWLGSMDSAALMVANLIGVDSINQWDITWDHMEQHLHAGNLTSELSLDVSTIALQDHEYQIAMEYSYLPG